MTHKIHAPIAKTVQHQTTMHDETLVDDYFWMRDRSDPDVRRYVDAENDYAEQVMAHAAPLREQLYAEMRGRIKETDESAPVRRGDFYYYSRLEEGKQYPLFLRKHGDLDASGELLLDQNALAAGHAYCRVATNEPSPDHRLLAYSIDLDGSEQYTLRFKNLETGEQLADQIRGTYYGFAWANDNRSVFYTVVDPAMRPFKVFRHTLGTDPGEDALVYHEPDEAFYIELAKTRSQAYVLISMRSTTTNEVRYLSADTPEAVPEVVQPRAHGLEYSVEHHDERFLIVCNDEAKNFKLVEAPVGTPGKEHWRDLLPHRPDVLVDGVDAFAGYLAVYERKDGLKQIHVIRPDGEEAGFVPFPEPVYTFEPGPNSIFDTTELRFTYSSPITPPSVIDYDMAGGAWRLRKQTEVLNGYDPARYQLERITATAQDGARIPISLAYPKGMARDGRNPLLLYAYGSYGFSSEPRFQIPYLSLLDRGWIVAIAHIRGGSELGREWYEQGKMLNKKNTFIDFIACAEHLIGAGYTSPERLAIVGGSAGGLLMGAVVNMRPELFNAVLAHVPFVDVINTMSDPSLPLTVIEWEQWGNPNDKEHFDYMRSYSPYDNVERKAYPHMLVTAGLNDPRVGYWEALKWVARLRAHKTDDHRLLLKTNTGAGHSGASGRYDLLEERAFHYAFLLDVTPEK